MLGWQLYLAAPFIKLFGVSYTTVRMSALLVAAALASLLQRTLVRTSITEHNATIGTVGLVLSPLYRTVSVTFITDIYALLGIVLCLYGCLRALQPSTSPAAIGWLCFAVATNANFGTSRQIARLGVLVMVPSAFSLLRAHRRVLLAGASATFDGALFILGCMLWFLHQPYNGHEHLLFNNISVTRAFAGFILTVLATPFLLPPITALCLPQMR